jgi:serine/threonine protein kinase
MLVTPDGVLKISDFGVTERMSTYDTSPITTSTFVGTHQFLAPEMTCGSQEVYTDRVDIWAAGITLYNMITGTYPFLFNEEGNTLELYERITTGAYDVPTDCSPELKSLFAHVLDKDPAARWSATRLMNHPFLLLSSQQLRGASGQQGRSPILPQPATPSSPAADRAFDQGLVSSLSLSRVAAPSVGGKRAGPRADSSPLGSMKDPHTIPTETTLIPILEAMLSKEIERQLTEVGRLQDMGAPGGGSKSGGGNKHSWFKNPFVRRAR